METLQRYSYAFTDNSNTVVAVLLFDDIADETLLAQVKEHLGAVEAVLCDNNNPISIGFTKINNKYYPPKPEENFVWSEEINGWVDPIEQNN